MNLQQSEWNIWNIVLIQTYSRALVTKVYDLISKKFTKILTHVALVAIYMSQCFVSFIKFQFQIKTQKWYLCKNSIQICMSCTKQTTNRRNEIRELKKSLCAGFVMCSSKCFTTTLPYFGKRKQVTKVTFLVKEQNFYVISTDINGISWCLT